MRVLRLTIFQTKGRPTVFSSDGFSFSRTLLLPALGATLFVTACGGIESSPLRNGFNAALDACEDQSSPDQRSDCFQEAMQDYTMRYEQYLQRNPSAPR